MKSISRTVLLVTIAAATMVHAASTFKEPCNEAEWKAFCQAPDYLKQIKAIQDKVQQQKVSATCLRAPWQKFTPSEKKAY